jgi:hypothetical protein
MRIETFPLIVAVVLAVIGIALIYDARTPDYTVLPRERRRSPRIDRDRRGEMMVGLGVLALAAAVAGRDVWRYRILATLIGGALLVWGSIRNRHFFGSLITDRGALRRRDRPADPLPGGPVGTRGSLKTSRPSAEGTAGPGPGTTGPGPADSSPADSNTSRPKEERPPQSGSWAPGGAGAPPPSPPPPAGAQPEPDTDTDRPPETPS